MAKLSQDQIEVLEEMNEAMIKEEEKNIDELIQYMEEECLKDAAANQTAKMDSSMDLYERGLHDF